DPQKQRGWMPSAYLKEPLAANLVGLELEDDAARVPEPVPHRVVLDAAAVVDPAVGVFWPPEPLEQVDQHRHVDRRALPVRPDTRIIVLYEVRVIKDVKVQNLIVGPHSSNLVAAVCVSPGPRGMRPGVGSPHRLPRRALRPTTKPS